MKTIRNWLEEEAGVTLSVTSLTSYVSRIRRRELHNSADHPASAFQINEATTSPNRSSEASDAARHDPLASAMAILHQRRFDIRQVHGDGDPTDKNLI